MEGLFALLQMLQQVLPTDPLFWIAVGAFAGLIGLVIIIYPADGADTPSEQASVEQDTTR